MLIKAHLPCKKCGSSDALAVYSDRIHCFSCKYTVKQESTSLFETSNKKSPEILLSDEIPIEAKKWLLKYRIFDNDIKSEGIKYNHKDNRIMLPLGNFSYQGRSLIPNSKIKYITYGVKRLPFFKIDNQKSVILTEDWCSAYRVYKSGFQSCALLGTSVKPIDLLCYINSSYSIILWLDGDKAGQDAVKKLSKSLHLYYPSIYNITTEDDPKTYSDDMIKHIVEKNIKNI